MRVNKLVVLWYAYFSEQVRKAAKSLKIKHLTLRGLNLGVSQFCKHANLFKRTTTIFEKTKTLFFIE
jgi:hypothetical protein